MKYNKKVKKTFISKSKYSIEIEKNKVNKIYEMNLQLRL